MMNFFLVFLTFNFFVVTGQAKCLDKCQFIPSFEWREQCNTCLEIPCFRWCSFTAYIDEGIERGCALYCEGYVNPRGYEQKQFVRYGSGFVPIRYDVNPGYLAHG
ncbi:unnamed protein product [Bathycoccus prasinos]